MTGPREWRHASDVLVECWNEVGEIGKEEVRALLDCTPEGEGVYIAPDGTLMRADADDCGCGQCETLYRLVPIEEATDD